MSDRFAVAVVGAGPAGTTAALRLARAGLPAVILEKARPPRYKTCGGGLVRRARRLLGLDLAGCIEVECAAELNLLDSGLSFPTDPGDPILTMTMRAELDQRLLEQAQQAGAQLRASCGLHGLEESPSRLALHTDRGTVEADYLIAADGVAGRAAELAGWRERLRLIPALESEISVDPATLERFSGSARFDFDAVPSGYAWVFPKRRHLSVGCLTRRPRGVRLRAALDEYLARIGIRPQRREDHGFAIPIAPRARRLARGRALLTGDAAGLADPVTCEGISHAIASAGLAAEAVIGHYEQPAWVRRAYHRALRSEILPELRIARAVAWGLYGFPRLRAALFRRAGEPALRAAVGIIAGSATYRTVFARPGNYLRFLRYLLAA